VQIRVIAVVGGVVLGLSMSARAEAQGFERAWVDVNVGMAKPAEDTFPMRATVEIFDEPASFGADYPLPRGASFDVGGGFLLMPRFGVGVSFSGTAHEEAANISARIPHPFWINIYASDNADTDEVLQRTEAGVNIQAMFVATQTDRLRLRFFGGPTYFRLRQDAVTDIRYTQTFSIIPASNAIEVTGFDAERVEGNGWGLHGGADVSFFFTRVLGVGGFAKYSAGEVEIENTLATAVDDPDDTTEVKTGGIQIGVGLRLKF
jgi:hypothetical protein